MRTIATVAILCSLLTSQLHADEASSDDDCAHPGAYTNRVACRMREEQKQRDEESEALWQDKHFGSVVYSSAICAFKKRSTVLRNNVRALRSRSEVRAQIAADDRSIPLRAIPAEIARLRKEAMQRGFKVLSCSDPVVAACACVASLTGCEASCDSQYQEQIDSLAQFSNQ